MEGRGVIKLSGVSVDFSLTPPPQVALWHNIRHPRKTKVNNSRGRIDIADVLKGA